MGRDEVKEKSQAAGMLPVRKLREFTVGWCKLVVRCPESEFWSVCMSRLLMVPEGGTETLCCGRLGIWVQQ